MHGINICLFAFNHVSRNDVKDVLLYWSLICTIHYLKMDNADIKLG